MTMLRRLFISLLILVGSVAAASGAERAIIVLDGSGSMWAQIAGVPRISIARDTLHSVLGELPGDLELGLMTYGAREKGNCSDIQLLVPPAAGTADEISAAADKISPKGMTPLSDAVRMAADELKYTEQRATVILITDGLETCHVDPCQLGKDLESKGVDFTAHVLGFGLSDEDGRKVACLAENTGGKYLSAQDGEGLVKALSETVAEAAAPEPAPKPAPKPEPQKPEYNLLPTASLAEGMDDLDSSEVFWQVFAKGADGAKTGEPLSYGYGTGYKENLDPGDYLVSATLGRVTQEQMLTLAAGEVAKPHFVLNAGLLKLHARTAEGEPADPSAAFEISSGAQKYTNYGEPTMYWPAGPIHVLATIGSATAEIDLDLPAGGTVDKDIVLGSGLAAISAVFAEGVDVEDAGMYIEVSAAKKDLEGNRKQVAYNYGATSTFNLPPGDYVVLTRLGEAEVETPFTVETGARAEVVANLNAGVLAIEAPRATFTEIFSAKKDIQGKRKSVSYSYDPSFQVVLPAGDYVIEASFGDDAPKTETEVSVTAGERSEASVE